MNENEHAGGAQMPVLLKHRDTAHSVSLRVDVSTRTLYILFHDEIQQQFPCAVGKFQTPTPIGQWIIREMTPNPSWHVLGTRWMGLNVPWGNYGVHGTNSPWSIGRYVSNGCVRMHNEHAEYVFSMVGVGIPVSITGSYPRSGVSSAGKPLARGSSGNEVLRLQLRLRELGFDPGPADGLFGPKTERALIAFQKANMLDQTGVADANSRQMLGV